MKSIEQVLLDPRNSSFQFWRSRYAETIVRSHADATITVESLADDDELPLGWVVERDHMSNQSFYFNQQTGEFLLDRPPSTEWSREVELLGRGFTPANVHETARLRVAIAENTAVAEARRELEELRMREMEPDAVAVAEVRLQIESALDQGGSLQCPRCGVRAVKDDACIHMDSCECGSKWCFLCGKLSTECRRGPGRGGCDQESYYLERHTGWGGFALQGENAAFGAQQEFLRRRQAFMVRAVMDETEPDLWQAVQRKHPDLLMNTPTDGRHINWSTLHEAEYPLFGGNRSNQDQQAEAAAAQRRLQEHRRQLRLEREEQTRRQAQLRRRQAICIPSAASVIAMILVGTSLMMEFSPPMSPVIHDLAGSGSGSSADLVPEPQPQPGPAPTPEPHDGSVELKCDWKCKSLSWIPQTEFGIGVFALAVSGIAWLKHGDQSRSDVALFGFCSLLAAALFLWPATLAPSDWLIANGWVALILNWFVVYILAPICVGMCGSLLLAALIAITFDTVTRDQSRTRDNIALGGAAVLGLTIYIYYIVAIHKTRSSNEDLVVQEPAFHFECDAACQWLTIVPLVEVIIGAGAVLARVALLLAGRRRDDACFDIVGSFLLAMFAFWPLLYGTKSFVAGSWLIAYILAPLSLGIGPPWLAWLAWLLLESIYDEQFEHFVPAERRQRLAQGLVAATATSTAVTIGCMVYLRHTTWFPEPTDGDSYICTWPCVALRATGAMTLGTAFFAQSVRARIWLAHQDDIGYAGYVQQVILIMLGLAALSLAVYESAGNWPVQMPVRELVTGSWLFYITLSAGSAVSTASAWTALLQIVGPRARMLSDVYSLRPALVGVSVLVPSWLLYVLRESAIERSDNEIELSPYSTVVLWESRALSYLGLVLLLYRWNYQEGAARRLTTVRACSRIARTLLLWLPAAAWPAVVAAVVSGTDRHPLDLAGPECGVMGAAGLECRHDLFGIVLPNVSFLMSALGFACELMQFNAGGDGGNDDEGCRSLIARVARSWCCSCGWELLFAVFLGAAVLVTNAFFFFVW